MEYSGKCACLYITLLVLIFFLYDWNSRFNFNSGLLNVEGTKDQRNMKFPTP